MYLQISTLVIFALFCAWVWYESHRTVRIQKKEEEAFWERERKANATRRKPIDHLDYIKIPDSLPYDVCADNDDVQAAVRTIKDLSKERILNLTGYSNTDLKLEYGAPNITLLSLYDQNYTTLVTTLQKWADVLLDNNETDAAIELMEFSVSTKSDVGKTYRLLAKHYLEKNENDKFDNLLNTIKETRSLNKDNILTSLTSMRDKDE